MKVGRTKGKGSSFVTANIGNPTKILQSVKLADDNMLLGHFTGANSHGQREDGNERFGDDCDRDGNSIQGYFICDLPLGHREDNDGKNDSTSQQEKSQPG